MRPMVITALSLLFLGVLTGHAAAQEVGAKLGAEEFAERCAVCHGDAGKGDGPVAEFLSIDVPDLTMLAQRNGGTFPIDRAFRIIDGRTEVRAHGTRKMPVWGYEYRKLAETEVDPERRPLRHEYFVTGRILSLVRYLESIQAK